MFIAASGTEFNPAQLTRRILYNSLTFNVGELVESLTSGYAKHPTAGAAALGIIVGFEGPNGALLRSPDVTKSTTAYNGSVDTYTTASDNTTNAQVVAVVCFDPTVVWSAQCNGTPGTTNASNLPSAGINVDSADSNYDRVLESTATRTAATVTNFVTAGNSSATSLDPNDSTRLLVRLSCSEIASSKKG